MRDLISEQRLQKLHPKVRDTAKVFIEEREEEFDVTIRITQGLRTFEEQDGLYMQSRDGSGRPWATNAKGGESFHNFGMAWDIVEMVNGKPNWNFDTAKYAAGCEKHGISWGGNFTHKDPDHFEMNFGHGSSGWKFFLDLYNAGKVDENGYVVF